MSASGFKLAMRFRILVMSCIFINQPGLLIESYTYRLLGFIALNHISTFWPVIGGSID